MLALAEKQMLIRALGQVIYDEVKTAIAPMIERIEKCEKQVIPWDDINEQLSAGIDMLSKQLDAKIAALPKPEKGDKGDQGEPGKDGRDGRDGADGKSISLDDVRACLVDLVGAAVADVPIPRNCVGGHIDRRGHLFLRFSDGSDSDLGEITGKNGADCDMAAVKTQVADFLATIPKPKDGKDGFNLDNFIAEYDGERTLTLRFEDAAHSKESKITFPIPLDRGIWKEGAYERADIVQRDGSMWIAERDTKSMPGLPDSGWRLCTKRGRDGKDGKQGKEGPQGKPGRDGRDLTQLGQDGSKW